MPRKSKLQFYIWVSVDNELHMYKLKVISQNPSGIGEILLYLQVQGCTLQLKTKLDKTLM